MDKNLCSRPPSVTASDLGSLSTPPGTRTRNLRIKSLFESLKWLRTVTVLLPLTRKTGFDLHRCRSRMVHAKPQLIAESLARFDMHDSSSRDATAGVATTFGHAALRISDSLTCPLSAQRGRDSRPLRRVIGTVCRLWSVPSRHGDGCRDFVVGEGEVSLVFLGEVELQDRVEAVEQASEFDDVVVVGAVDVEVVEDATKAADEMRDLDVGSAHGAGWVLAAERAGEYRVERCVFGLFVGAEFVGQEAMYLSEHCEGFGRS